MSKPAIRVDGLSKRYHIAHGEQRQQYKTLRESLTSLVKKPFAAPTSVEEFWALKDVSFEVQPGEVVGIIGRNGAGKSTLLKILSRITKPTGGRVEINGRVGSLLEVGTGFHPELTGRENIYLNGAILGMTRREIAKKFDEIVAFAEVEKFLDTPVKRYSSGMYVRLAFAVAANLEPEILIIDEVLAVGDAAFQRKCLGKMGEFAASGHTVLFVSHQMSAVQSLCSHGILLERGQLQAIGPKTQIIAKYASSTMPDYLPGKWICFADENPRHSKVAWLTKIRCSSDDKEAADNIYPDGPAIFEVGISANQEAPLINIGLSLYDRFDTHLVYLDSAQIGSRFQLVRGTNEFRFFVPSLHLNPGAYRLEIWIGDGENIVDIVRQAVTLTVTEYQRDSSHSQMFVAGLVPCRFEVSSAVEVL